MKLKSEYCPVCEHEIIEHRVQDFIDCIEKLNDRLEMYYPLLVKNQEALRVIDGLLESPHSDKSVMVSDSISVQDILEKLKETLEE